MLNVDRYAKALRRSAEEVVQHDRTMNLTKTARVCGREDGKSAAADDLRNNFRLVANLVGLEITELTFVDKETGRVYK